MTKDEILARSRNENKDADIYEKEILKTASNISVITAACVTAGFFLTELIVKDKVNLSLWAIMFSISAATFWVKAIKLKKTHELVLAICYTALTLLMAGQYIFALFTNTSL